MPLESFTGSDIPGLLATARRALGSDAVLVSVRRRGLGRAAVFELIAADPVTAAVATRSTPPRSAARAPASPRPVSPPPAPPFDPEPPPFPARPGNPPPALTTMSPLLAGARTRRRHEPVVIALVGPTGAGKTTTIAKLARHPRVFAGIPVGVLCLNTYRIGAVEQLRIYADIAELPLEVVYEPGELKRAMRRLRDCEIVLVDTAGRGPAARADGADTRARLRELAPAEVHLVLPAGLQPRLARRVLAQHRELGVTHLIATKLDEFPDDPSVFELAAELRLPMRWFTDGQEVPLDLRPAASHRSGAVGEGVGA